MKQLNGITLNGLQVSDLFFNSPLLHYGNACEAGLPVEPALREDAIEFAALIGNQIEPQNLVADFLARV